MPEQLEDGQDDEQDVEKEEREHHSANFTGAEGVEEGLEAEQEERQREGAVSCRWSQWVKEKGITEAEERRAALQSADEVFLSLFEEQPEDGEDSNATEARERLKFFIALQLERKRILKPLGGRRFRHMPTKRELTVPDLEITPEYSEVGSCRGP